MERLHQILSTVIATYAADPGWDPPQRFPAMQVLPATRRSENIVFIPKRPAYEFLQRYASGWPDENTVVERVGLVLPYVFDVIAGLSAPKPPRIYFVGDIDPFTLVVYLSIRVGGIGGRGPGEATVVWRGIGDDWIDLCERTLLQPHKADWGRFGAPVVPSRNMSDLERRMFASIDLEELHWDEIIGLQALNILRGGKVLSIDQACEPTLYDATFKSELSALIYGRLNQ